MKSKSKYTGLGIALGAGLGAALGAMAGNMGVWLAVGVGVGVAIGASIRRKGTTARCARTFIANTATASGHERGRS
jgi:hypothetical protein